jgi:DNA primase
LADDRIKQVKEANDIVDVVGSYVALRPAGPTFKGLCPFHDDSRPSFDVDPRRQRYRCWACGKYGDVLQFIQEHERVPFVEALELLARRAGINLERKKSPQDQTRARLLDVMRWADHQYHQCFLGDPLAEEARQYVVERGLSDETIRTYGLGFAPRTGDWLLKRAEAAKVPLALLETVGLIGARSNGPGHYDRFRDRVQFPIRDVNGRTVAFAGRILPETPLSSPGPKYYNSSNTPLFTKSEHLYGLDRARHEATKAGFLAVVEGYTDVLMAHQMGVLPVVATMGTALNARHVQQLRRFAPRVVLVFDADAGGDTGVDRALEIFAGQEAELAIATLPEGLDPCDLLLRDGPDAFRQVLQTAVDALEFKLSRVLTDETAKSVEGRRRAVEAVLKIISLAPVLPGEAGSVKTQLMVSRIARRLALQEETVWKRLGELRQARQVSQERRAERRTQTAEPPQPRQAPAAPEERELLEVLLAAPELVAQARAEIPAATVEHPGLRRLLEGLYALHDDGEPATLDGLRPRLDHPRLAQKALELMDVGRSHPDPAAWLQQIVLRLRERSQRTATQELRNQLQAADDHDTALELLRQLQTRSSETCRTDCSSVRCEEDG